MAILVYQRINKPPFIDDFPNVEDFSLYIWLVVWNMAFMTFHSVGNGKSSQLTNSIIFQRGRYTTNQPNIACLTLFQVCELLSFDQILDVGFTQCHRATMA